ncbi:MAG: aminopeptidase P N-terminal domain-containing protein [bacterium]
MRFGIVGGKVAIAASVALLLTPLAGLLPLWSQESRTCFLGCGDWTTTVRYGETGWLAILASGAVLSAACALVVRPPGLRFATWGLLAAVTSSWAVFGAFPTWDLNVFEETKPAQLLAGPFVISGLLVVHWILFIVEATLAAKRPRAARTRPDPGAADEGVASTESSAYIRVEQRGPAQPPAFASLLYVHRHGRSLNFADLAPGPAPQLPLSSYTKRRAKLAKQLGDGHALVVATHPTHQFSHDVDYVFRPHSDFWYLTGFNEPGAVLVLQGGSGASTLFLRDRKKEAEIWTGRRLGVERAGVLDVDRAYDITELSERLKRVLGKSKVHAISDHDSVVRRRVARAAGRRWVEDDLAAQRPGGPPKGGKRRRRTASHGRELVHEMRLVKEPAELKMLQKACDLGVEAHLRAARGIVGGGQEFEVEADFVHQARHSGSTGVGYPSICGCGPNAAVLHYVSNLDRLRAGELFLIDAGCEWGYYTSDITRTYPVGGEFSRRQVELYELVLAAHNAAMREVRPGVPFRAPHEKAVEVLTSGLVDLGMLSGSVEKAVKTGLYRSFFMHGTSHWLGLDVHDAGAMVGPDGKPRLLKEGMVLTIEPGLYFNPDYATCPPGTAGIGIRIEDDVAVTEGGRRNMTARLPTDPDDLSRPHRNKG